MVSANRDGRSRSESRSRSSSNVSTNRNRIRCYKCREYEHFARECPSAMTDEESDHSNLDQAALQMLTQENSLIQINMLKLSV